MVAPVITALVPPSAPIGAAALTLTVVGDAFLPGDVVTFNGGDEATVMVSATQLTTQVKPFVSTTPGDYPVAVRRGVEVSNAIDFTLGAADLSYGSLLLQQLSGVLTREGTYAALAAASDDDVATIRREWQAWKRPEVSGTVADYAFTTEAIRAEMARRGIPF
jgi:hypothetical protein